MIFSKVFGRISMLGLIVFKGLASSFWGKWWEISLCCCHPLGYDFGVILYVVRHDLSHAYSCFDKVQIIYKPAALVSQGIVFGAGLLQLEIFSLIPFSFNFGSK